MFLFCFCLVCMTINNGSVQYNRNGGFLPDILLLLTQAPIFVWFEMAILYYYYPLYYILQCLLFCYAWWLCMAINISVLVHYNGGLLPDIILLTQCYYHRGIRLKRHEEDLYLYPIIPPKRFDIFPPGWGMLKRSRCVQFFL